ncbi:MAG TPA: hypothetical protein VFT16_00015 [Candidatus Saccharimonadales bacterium]|nr:hypothetical protein [Candidatus Saccharimonadales bacterium]
MFEKFRANRTRLFMAGTALALLAGTVIGWTTVFGEVERYCDDQGTGLGGLIRLSGEGNVTNPLLAPCFWGSVAFVIALAWALYVLFDNQPQKRRKSIRGLWWLLLGGTVFAFVNNLPVFLDFYTKPKGTVTGCSPDAITSPFLTGCFGGFASFAAALVFVSLALWSIRRLKKKHG